MSEEFRTARKYHWQNKHKLEKNRTLKLVKHCEELQKSSALISSDLCISSELSAKIQKK